MINFKQISEKRIFGKDPANGDAGCAAALKQIEDMKYETALRDGGYHTIIKYGIACYKKHCKVVRG